MRTVWRAIDQARDKLGIGSETFVSRASVGTLAPVGWIITGAQSWVSRAPGWVSPSAWVDALPAVLSPKAWPRALELPAALSPVAWTRTVAVTLSPVSATRALSRTLSPYAWARSLTETVTPLVRRFAWLRSDPPRNARRSAPARRA